MNALVPILPQGVEELKGQVQIIWLSGPFGTEHIKAWVPEGFTLQQIVDKFPGLPKEEFEQSGTIYIGRHVVFRKYWGSIRPRAGKDDIVLVLPPTGGASVKNIIGIALSIALIAATSFILAGGLAVGGFFLANSMSAALLAGAVGILGRIAISQLIAPPAKPKNENDNRANSLGESATDSNLIQPNGPYVRVIGTRLVYPEMQCYPVIELVDDDEYASVVYALAGPHKLEDIRIEGVPINNTGTEYQIREGFETDEDQTLVLKQAFPVLINATLQGHLKDSGANFNKLKTRAVDPDLSLPQPYIIATKKDPDSFLIQLTWPQGLADAGDTNELIAVPIRLRLRIAGTSTWIKLPEIHFAHSKLGPIRRYVRFIWEASPSRTLQLHPAAIPDEGAYIQFHTVPVSTLDDPAMPGWVADSSFINTATLHDVKNMAMEQLGYTFYLDPAVFPLGNRWEVELLRGNSYQATRLNKTTYAWNLTADFLDFFGRTGDYVPGGSGISILTKTTIDETVISRVSNFWHETPTPEKGICYLAIKGRNINIRQVSCIASSYVPDWNGSSWSTIKTTRNPAPHYRDVMAGLLNTDPIPADLVDNAELAAWRSSCTDYGWQVSAAVAGMAVQDVLELIASTGLARPRLADRCGVVVDYDNIYEDPVQIFTPMNAADMTMEKLFDDEVHAFRVTFLDEANNYEASEVLVVRNGMEEIEATNIIAADASGLSSESLIQTIFKYNLDVIRYRNYTWRMKLDLQHVMCERGDSIGVSHPVMISRAGYGRIIRLDLNAAQDLVKRVYLDNYVSINSTTGLEAIADLEVIADLLSQGVQMSAVISLIDGSIRTVNIDQIIVGEVSTLVIEELGTPIDGFFHPDGDTVADLLVTVGPSKNVFERFKLLEVVGDDKLRATLTLTPEAPEIYEGLIAASRGYPWSDEGWWSDGSGWAE